jgi:hypothetical protein
MILSAGSSSALVTASRASACKLGPAGSLQSLIPGKRDARVTLLSASATVVTVVEVCLGEPPGPLADASSLPRAAKVVHGMSDKVSNTVVACTWDMQNRH